MPPPVLPGDEPINMSMHVRILPDDDIAVWSIDEKPAVELAITAWNMLFKSFCPPFMPAKAGEFHSDASIKNMPNSIKIGVMHSTIFVCSLYRRKRNLHLSTSLITVKPNAPSMESAAIITSIPTLPR